MIRQKIDLKNIMEWGIIVDVPYSYISKYRNSFCTTPQDAALSIIWDYSNIKMEDYGPFKFDFKDDFEHDCMYVKITSTKNVDGLFCVLPGAPYVHLNIWRLINDS